MRKIDQLLNEYGESHRNPVNKAIHWICVPSIFFSIVGLLWSIPVDLVFGAGLSEWINIATLALLLVTVYYIGLSLPLALGMLLFAIACMLLARYLDVHYPGDLWKISILIFVIAWTGQFYGHHVEGKKPSFIKDVQFLLIGPAWLMHFVFKQLNIKY